MCPAAHAGTAAAADTVACERAPAFAPGDGELRGRQHLASGTLWSAFHGARGGRWAWAAGAAARRRGTMSNRCFQPEAVRQPPTDLARGRATLPSRPPLPKIGESGWQAVGTAHAATPPREPATGARSAAVAPCGAPAACRGPEGWTSPRASTPVTSRCRQRRPAPGSRTWAQGLVGRARSRSRVTLPPQRTGKALSARRHPRCL